MLKVSVIVPTYNRSAYLQAALASIQRQTYPPFEIIVIDDGSTDDTPAVISSAGPNVRYLQQNHLGVVQARNAGLAAARGDVIAWLDSDDLWQPDFLAVLIPMLERDPQLQGVYCGSGHIDPAGNVLPAGSQNVAPPEQLFSHLIENDFIVTPALVVRKSCYDAVGAFDPQFGICEDYDMWLRLAKRFRIAGIPDRLVDIRVHADSTMMRDTEDFCRFRIALTRKHFGEAAGDPEQWSEDKRRAYAFAYLACGLTYMQAGRPDQGWQYVEDAVHAWSKMLTRLDLYYELACGAQPRGHRGQAAELDVRANGARVLAWLDTHLAQGGPRLGALKAGARSSANLALAMLSDQAGLWGQARRYLLTAVAANPRLLASPPVIRRLIKLFSGHRLVNALRARRESSRGLPLESPHM